MTTTETTHRHHDAESKERQHKSTSIPFAIHELDDEDCLIIRLDRKDPARRKIMGAIQAALEQDQRTDEATRAKAYAAERLPDDWRRKMPSVSGDPNDPGTRAYRKPAE
jgi:hypothetical protein